MSHLRRCCKRTHVSECSILVYVTRCYITYCNARNLAKEYKTNGLLDCLMLLSFVLWCCPSLDHNGLLSVHVNITLLLTLPRTNRSHQCKHQRMQCNSDNTMKHNHDKQTTTDQDYLVHNCTDFIGFFFKLYFWSFYGLIG